MGKNIKTYTVKELLELSAPALSDLWLVEGLIPKNNISALVGPSDCGKSTWARQLALCVADNKPDFLGLPLYGVNNTVCYISTEDDEATTRAVLNKQNQGLQIKGGLDKLSFAFDNEDIGEKLEHLLLCANSSLVWRYSRVYSIMVQAKRARGILLLLYHLLHWRIAAGICIYERYPRIFPT